jgi:Transposase DDE domain group 1
VRLLHELTKIHARFDDPNLVSHAGLVPVMALAQRAGLGDLAAEYVRIARPCGVNAPVKIACLAAGMAAGADSIDDMNLLRHRAMPDVFGGIRAPSTLGSFLRSFNWGNVLQLQKVHRQVLAELTRRVPLLPGKDVLAFVDIDSQQKRVYGHAKQGAAFGHTKIQGKGVLVRGLNALAATICTPLAAPVIAGTKLRSGNASSARGAASMITEAVSTARAAGCTGTLVVRMDSAFYGSPAVRAARNAGARFSVTVRTDPKIRAAIAAIPDDAWISIRYPRAIWDRHPEQVVHVRLVLAPVRCVQPGRQCQRVCGTGPAGVRASGELHGQPFPQPCLAVHRGDRVQRHPGQQPALRRGEGHAAIVVRRDTRGGPGRSLQAHRHKSTTGSRDCSGFPRA